MDRIETLNIEELVEGSDLFKSRGISYLKVTKNGVVKRLAIPIKSSGVSELIDEFKKKAPQPPVIFTVVTPDSEIGKELKLTRKQHVKTFDLTDENYLEEREKYETDLGLKIVLQGIAVPIKDKEGNVVEDDDKKLEILRNMGITGEQFTQLVRDIRLLTMWEEEREEDFLSE